MEYTKKLERNIRLFYLLNFLTGLLFPVAIWVIFERRVLTFEQMALFSALGTGIETLCQIPTGAFADLIGRRVSLFVGWLITGLAYILYAYANTPAAFFIVFCAGGIGSALSSGADVALVYDSLKSLHRENEYPKIAAKMKLFYRFAIAIATLTGGLIYGFNIHLPALLQSSAIFISLIFIVLMSESTLSKEAFSAKEYLLQMKQGFKELQKGTYVKSLVIYYTLVGSITWACLNYFNLPFMTEVGFSPVQLGILFAIAYIVVAVVIYFLTKSRESILTRSRIYLAFPILMAIGLLPGIIANSAIAPILLIIVLLTGSGRLTFLDTYVNEEFVSQYRATALSALNMLVSISYIVLVTLGGKIQDAHGTKIIFTGLGVITVLVVFPSALQLIKHHKHYKESPVLGESPEEKIIG